jgi:hypothetical protein
MVSASLSYPRSSSIAPEVLVSAPARNRAAFSSSVMLPGASKAAQDEATAQRLWELSKELTGLTPARPAGT